MYLNYFTFSAPMSPTNNDRFKEQYNLWRNTFDTILLGNSKYNPIVVDVEMADSDVIIIDETCESESSASETEDMES